MGLFNDQGTQASANASPGGSSDALSVSRLSLGSQFEAGSPNSAGSNAVGKDLTLSPSFSLLDLFPSASKSSDADFSKNCRVIDSKNAECNVTGQGPVNGSLDAAMIIHLTENTKTKLAGHFDFSFNFKDFTFKNDCGKEEKVAGLFGCALDFTEELINQNQEVKLSLSGLCNTAKDSDHLIDFQLGDAKHQVGYDLALDFDAHFPVTQSRQVQLDESNISGTIYLDGVKYDYGALKNLSAALCQ